jgi:uncharacterized tellurite resistance protein B-like protein
MVPFLNGLKKQVLSSLQDDHVQLPGGNIDENIALGVLLWVVAEADEKFLPQEEEKIKEVLVTHSHINEKELSVVLASIKVVAEERIDIFRFTNEVSKELPYAKKIEIIEILFRVACADKDLDENELELIRKISGLFHISHKDFIDAKIGVKKEFGLDTVGL